MELQYLVREPQNITPETPILFMLHGYGSNEEDLFNFVPTLPEDWLVVSFRAPKNSNYGGYVWFDIDFNTHPLLKDFLPFIAQKLPVPLDELTQKLEKRILE